MSAAFRVEAGSIPRVALLALVGVSLVGLFLPSHGEAALSKSTLIDGPSFDVLELGGVAMADDGTGGLVYRRRDSDGRSHIFAVRFAGSRWRGPIRVDAGQTFDSTWPRIAAGAGGRLLVAWAQEFGASSDRLYSANLDPGATRFDPPIPIDLDIDEATSTFPQIAMNNSGTAYAVYRVVTATKVSDPTLLDGFVKADLRVARLNAFGWAPVGRLNRNPDTQVREPSAANAPRITITQEGNGLVVFSEPDDNFVARVWARRLLGSASGIPLAVSPLTFNNAAVPGAADNFSLAGAGFGQGAVAFYQQAGGPFDRPRVLVNTIPERFDQRANEFRGAKLIDDNVAAGPAGATSVGVTPTGAFLATFGAGNATLIGSGDDGAANPPDRLDGGANIAPGDAVVTMGTLGQSVVAWKSRTASGTGTTIQERPRRGRPRSGRVSAAKGGAISELEIAGSGLGDALVAFRQGVASNGQIAAAVVDAPPSRFTVTTPIPYVRPGRAKITWDRAPDTLSNVRYSPLLDGRTQARSLDARSFRLSKSGLEDGIYTVRVLATDSAGQQTLSEEADLKVDGTPPRASVRVRGKTVSVRVVDGRRRRSSGPRRASTTISFGDGMRVKRKVRTKHRYKRSGSFKLVVNTRDRAGNRGRVVRTVRVR